MPRYFARNFISPSCFLWLFQKYSHWCSCYCLGRGLLNPPQDTRQPLNTKISRGHVHRQTPSLPAFLFCSPTFWLTLVKELEEPFWEDFSVCLFPSSPSPPWSLPCCSYKQDLKSILRQLLCGWSLKSCARVSGILCSISNIVTVYFDFIISPPPP